MKNTYLKSFLFSFTVFISSLHVNFKQTLYSDRFNSLYLSIKKKELQF